MKIKIIAWAWMAIVISLMSCKSGGDDKPETIPFSVTPTEVTLAADGTASLNITSGTDWTVGTITGDWLSVSPISGHGSTTVTLSVTDGNSTGQARTAQILFTEAGGSQVAVVTVTQEPATPRLNDIVDATASSTKKTDGTVYRVTGIVSNISGYSLMTFSLSDYTGDCIITDNAANPVFRTLGLKNGDVVTVLVTANTGNSLNAVACEKYYPVTDITVTQFLNKPDDAETYYRLTGTITEITSEVWGNLYLTDGTNSVFVYGTYPGWGATGNNRKNCIETKNIEVGDKITILGSKTTYNGTPELYNGIYVSHEKGATSQTIYREPYTVWGATMSQTKSYMSGYTLYKEETTSLAYIGKDKETLIMYNFVDSKLSGSAVAVATSAATRTEIDAQLQSRGYQYVGEEDGTYIYLSTDQKTIATISENSSVGAYYIYYLPYSESPSTKLFEEPYVNWGATRSTVKSAVSNRGYTLVDESTSSSDNYYLAYDGKYKESFTMYQFDSSMKLSQAIIACSPSSVSLADARSYVASSSGLSYTYVTTSSDGNQYFYLSSDGNTIAIVYTLTSGTTKLTTISFISYSSVVSSTRQLSRGAAPENFTPMEIPESALGDLLLKRLSMMVKQHISAQPSFPVIIK